MTIDEAARELGLSVDAIRKARAARQNPPREGRRRPCPDNTGRSGQRLDITGPSAALIAELRDRARSLERRLDEEQEARRRTDTILAQLARANEEQARTIRELGAPQEPRESPASPGPSGFPQEPREEAQGAAERPLKARFLHSPAGSCSTANIAGKTGALIWTSGTTRSLP